LHAGRRVARPASAGEKIKVRQCIAETLHRQPVEPRALRKAIGAKKNEISQQFLMESVVLTFIGGIIGIGYWEGAICSTDPRAAAKAMKHVRDLVGIQHVALGSDYDGATTVRFDTSQLAQVTQALMDEGFTPDEIRAVMGENALRVIRAGLVPMEKAAAAQ
jgi:microsomal dipeptidase-like Zn-dependent dipeptidase